MKDRTTIVAYESVIIALIGIADLVTTVLWVQHHGAQEANPVFAHYLAMGVAWFALMKLVLLAAPIYLLEWARRRRPTFTRRASRFAIVAYLAMYCIGFARLNPDILTFRLPSANAAVIDGDQMRNAVLMPRMHLQDARAYFMKHHKRVPPGLKRLLDGRAAML